MSVHTKAFENIDMLTPEFIKFWKDVSNLESPTSYKKGVDAVGDYIASYAEKECWEIERFKHDIVGNVVCITMNIDSTEAPITLSGHMDTAHAVGSFGTPAVRIDENNIYGPGVMDCKGGIVAAMLAMKALKNEGFKNRPVRLLLQSDEENVSAYSNKATINYICQKASDSIAFLNCESTRKNTAVLWRKGCLRYMVRVKGKSIHGSRCAEGGVSAIQEAAYKIIKLEEYPKAVEGLSFNCGTVKGGVLANTVPDNCCFNAEIRYSTEAQLEQGKQILTEILSKTYLEGTSTEWEIESYCPAMEKTKLNFELLDKINEIYKKCDLPCLTARGSLGGSDAAAVTVAGIPCVDAIGVAGDYIHTPREYATLSSLPEAAKRIASVCLYI
ncbi:MAG: M20/M25/M40 family metallo-hydrolase [Clostridia bacterium]|nr:M20/M25/M40 family metallo-hydrolase [Clostridia bacterium]